MTFMKSLKSIGLLFTLFFTLTAGVPLAGETVRLQLKWHHQFQFAGYYAAVEKGFYNEVGLDVRIREGRSEVYPVAEVAGGRAEYGVAGPEAFLNYLRGVPVVVLAVIFQHSPRVIIARAQADIRSPQDLVGKSVRMGDNIENMVEPYAMLLREGVAVASLRTSGEWSMERFINGEWDAFAGHVSVHPHYLKNLKVPINIIQPITYGIDFYGDSLITSAVELENHPERVKRFRSASLKGWQYAMRHEDELIDIILAKYPGEEQQVSREVLKAEAEAMHRLILPELVEIGHMNVGRWQHIADVYHELGLIREKAQFETFIYDPDPAPNVQNLYLAIGVILVVGLVVLAIALKLLRMNRQLRGLNERLRSEITEREQIEAELRKRSRAIEQSASTIVITDRDGTIEYVNPAFTSITGYSREEALGQNPRILKSNRHSRRFYERMWKTLLRGETWRGEMLNKKASGELYWELVTISPVLNQSGTISHYVAIKEDISVRKQMELDLKVAKREADSANQAKSAFLANMSHELRTPLNGIIGFSQVLERQISGKLSEKQSEYFNTIRESGNHLLQMVNDILDLSKIEAGKIELNMMLFDIETMLLRAPSIIKSAAYEKKLTIETDIQKGIGLLHGDEVRLKQVFYNLLSNAVKFTEPGKKIGINGRYEDGNVIVEVWDEGIGISEKDLEIIFNPFEQVPQGSNISAQGTGLGLSISRRLVELHNGTLTATSEPGNGSCFKVVLPGRISDEEDAPPGKPVQELPENQHHTTAAVTVLIVEDNPTNAELLTAVLGEYDLDFARNGEEAVKKAEKQKYDLILMDIQLPGMDGVRAMKQINKGNNRETPIVALTSFAMKGDREKYLKEGFHDYLSKPIDIEELLSKIDNTLNAARRT